MVYLHGFTMQFMCTVSYGKDIGRFIISRLPLRQLPHYAFHNSNTLIETQRCNAVPHLVHRFQPSSDECAFFLTAYQKKVRAGPSHNDIDRHYSTILRAAYTYYLLFGQSCPACEQENIQLNPHSSYWFARSKAWFNSCYTEAHTCKLSAESRRRPVVPYQSELQEVKVDLS